METASGVDFSCCLAKGNHYKQQSFFLGWEINSETDFVRSPLIKQQQVFYGKRGNHLGGIDTNSPNGKCP